MKLGNLKDFRIEPRFGLFIDSKRNWMTGDEWAELMAECKEPERTARRLAGALARELDK